MPSSLYEQYQSLPQNNQERILQNFRQNPASILPMLSQRFNIPQGIDMNNPDAILQHLLNTNQVSQEQVNKVMQMRNDPRFQRQFNRYGR